MPSKKPSMIDALRAKHDPHYQLASKVEGLGKDLPIQVAQLHKTLSKSFAMQRKTLVRVLGLEKRVTDNETRISNLADVAIKIGQQQAEKGEAASAAVEEVDAPEAVDEMPEGLDDLIDEVRGEKEVGGTKTKAKPKAKAKPKVKPKAKKTRVTGKRISKPKIDADKFKRGTSQETLEERLERQARNRQETAAAEEHKKTDEFTETTTGTDPKTGEPLSSEERKKRFKAAKFMNKTGFDSKDIKPETEAEMGEDSKKDKIVTFLNGDVKDNLDDVRDDLKQIEGLLKDQNKSADDQYEEMRQGILTAKKKKREEKLEDKDKKPGSGLKDKMLDMVTKPAGGFFNKLIKFVTMTFLGVIVNRLLSILKDPAQLLDPIKQFFNVFIGMFNAVMKGLWMITGAPINFVISTINKGVKGIIDGINSVSSLLLLPKIDPPQIPLIPGPPQVPMIPLSKTAQSKNEGDKGAVGMSGGGVVPGPQGDSGKDGKDGTTVAMSGGGLVPGYAGGGMVMGYGMGEIMPDQFVYNKQEFKSILKTKGGEVIEDTSTFTDIGGAIGMPDLQEHQTQLVESLRQVEGYENINFMDVIQYPDGKGKLVGMPEETLYPILNASDAAKATSAKKTAAHQKFLQDNDLIGPDGKVKGYSYFDGKIKVDGKTKDAVLSKGAVRKFSGGGVVPYSNSFILGTGHNVIDTAPENIMGYNKGGKVPGSGNGDTVPAMLTPGEFVMSKGAVNMIGADKLMAMNKAGGGTNVPKMMKFAGGGIVPGIDAPNKKSAKVVVIGGGGGAQPPSQVSSSGGSGDNVPSFSSTDPNNMATPAVKSIYNVIG